jgi:hypothetical protein
MGAEEEEEQLGKESGQGGSDDRLSSRLQDLQLPAAYNGSTCTVAKHLVAAWGAALADCGVHPAAGDGADEDCEL